MISSFFSTTLFFFNDTAPTEIYTLSLHDALPILARSTEFVLACRHMAMTAAVSRAILRRRSATASFPWRATPDRKSTRLNSSHSQISYAVFCLKKKTQLIHNQPHTLPHPLTYGHL